MLARWQLQAAFRIIDRAEVQAKSGQRTMLIVAVATLLRGGMLAAFIALVNDMIKSRAAGHPRSLMTTIPYGRQDVNEADLVAVVEVLRSDFLTQGPGGPTLHEQTVANYCGAQHAVAVNSATSGLHIA